MAALIEELIARGTDMTSLGEAAKLRLLGSQSLHMHPADYRVRCARAVDELVAPQDAIRPEPVKPQ
jgi:hypothetical protein